MLQFFPLHHDQGGEEEKRQKNNKTQAMKNLETPVLNVKYAKTFLINFHIEDEMVPSH